MNINLLRSKLEEVRAERLRQEHMHAQSSDWHSPPSLVGARYEGQELILEWLIAQEEQIQSIVSDIKLEINEHHRNRHNDSIH